MPTSRDHLEIRGRLLTKLGRWNELLETLDALLALEPDPIDPAKVRQRRDLLRRKAVCLDSLDRLDEAGQARAQAVAIPDRAPHLGSAFLDLTEFYTDSLFQTEPVANQSQEFWWERLPDIFDPAEGPEFDLRGKIQLNSGIYPKGARGIGGRDFSKRKERDFPDQVVLPIDRKFGAIHFLQSCHFGHELTGTEVARYIIYYEDESSVAVPVVFGEDIADLWIHDLHRNKLASINHIALEQKFRGDWGGEGTIALFRQTWTNPHPEKGVTHLEFVSAKTLAAPFLVAVSLESHASVQQRISNLIGKLDGLDASIAGLPESIHPADVRRHRELLRQKVPLLEKMGRRVESLETRGQLVAVPPRPPELSPKMIDLTNCYTESLFKSGSEIAKHSEQFWWERLPEVFDPEKVPGSIFVEQSNSIAEFIEVGCSSQARILARHMDGIFQIKSQSRSARNSMPFTFSSLVGMEWWNLRKLSLTTTSTIKTEVAKRSRSALEWIRLTT